MNWLRIRKNTEMHKIKVSDLEIEVIRKDIKNLHLAVHPPDGRVRASSPLLLDDEAIRLAVISKLAWIRGQQTKFRDQDRQSIRDYVTGESHYLWGERYLMNVIYHQAPPQVEVRNKSKIDLYVREGSDRNKREEVLQEWYREQLKAAIPDLIDKWEDIIGEEVAGWGVKRMKTKWGTCTIEERRIWLNLELAKKSPLCLEYIIVHEMVHLLERHHNDRFVGLMDQFMPKWRLHRDELNQAPLVHEKWGY